MKMCRYCSYAGILMALLASTIASRADVILNSHTRFVDASISNPAASDNKTAPDAGPFSETATAEVSFNGETSRAISSQASTFAILGDTLIASASVEGRLETRTLPNSIADANSHFELQFTLDAPGTYSLIGVGSVFGSTIEPGLYGSYIVMLDGPGGTVFDHRDGGLPAGVFDEAFNDTGVLAPGNYTFIARGLSTGAGNVMEGGSADFTFTVDAPGGPTPVVPLPSVFWAGAAISTYVMGWRRRR